MFLVAIGGSIGSSFRFLLTEFFRNYFLSNNYYFGTLLVNIIGSFLIGLIISLSQKYNFSDDLIKYFVIIGVLGSFTTFSTFSYEVIELLYEKKIFLASTYIFSSLILCISFTYLGFNMSKIIN